MRYAIVANPRDRVTANLVGAGSIGIVTFHLGRGLARRSHEVTLVTGRGPGQSSREQFETGLNVIRVRSPFAKVHKYRERAASIFDFVPPHFLSTSYFLEFFLGAALALRPLRPDIIHIQNHGQAAGIFRALFPEARIVVQLHDTAIANASARVAARVLGDADLVVTCSEYVSRSIREAHPELRAPVRTINNGVNISDFKPDSNGGTHPRSGIQLLYIGRLSPEKGVQVLIEAFNELIRRLPATRLDLVGGSAMFPYSVVKLFSHDPHWAALKPFYGNNPLQRLLRMRQEPGGRYLRTLKQLQSEAAAQGTRFLGEQPPDRVAQLTKKADIVVLPSVCDEPFGMPAIEAMAAGIPVAAAAAGGLQEIVQDGATGLLVPRSNPGALAEAIMALAASPERRASMGRAGRAAVSQRFTWEHAVQRLLSALDETGLTNHP